MKDGRNQFGIDRGLSIWSIAIYFLLVFLKIFFENYDFSLSDFSNIYISRAALDGVSVDKRISFFYQACVLCLVLLPFLYYLFRLFFNRFPKSRSILTCFSLTGIMMMVSDMMFYDSDKSLKTITILIVITGLLQPFKKLNKVRRAWPILISISFIVTGGLLFLFNSAPVVTAQPETFFCVLTVLFAVLYYLINKLLGVSSRRLFISLSPLALSPLLIFLSVEFDFLFREKYTSFSPKLFFLAGLLVSFAIVLFFRKKARVSSNLIAERFFAPAALLSFLVLAFYHPFIDQPTDFFELANPANAQMLMFKFGKLPFIDFMTSHLFSEQWFGVGYHFLFGYDGTLDFMVYSFFNVVLFYFLVFYFSKRLFFQWGPALLLVILMPYLNLIFFVELFLAVPAFLACLHAVNRPTIKNHLLVALALAILVIWRLDTGVAALMASVVFLPMAYFVRRKMPSVKMLLNSFGITLISLLVLLVIAVLIRSGEAIYDNFLTALHYVSGSQAHGFSQIAREFTHQLIIILFVVPLVSCVLLFMSVRRLFYAVNGNHNFPLYASVFFFLIFLVNFQRGLVRHGFLEAQDDFYMSTFFLALALFAVSFFEKAKPFVLYSIFCSVSLLALVTIKYFGLPEGKSTIETFFTESALVDLDTKMATYDGRVLGREAFAEDNYRDLNEFLDDHLHDDQTFLDFSNTPMLYFYTGRNVPSYFAQSLQNSIDDFTQLNHLSRLDTNRVPMVIFSHEPPNWMDATDGVANSMRYYLIAEYIYKNYRPAAVVNDLNLWLPKSRMENFSLDYDNRLAHPNYHYGYAPISIYKHFENNREPLKKISETKVIDQFITLNDAVRGQSSLFLSLALRGEGPDGLVVISLYSGDQKVGVLELYAAEGERNYMLPLTNSLAWYEFNPDRIRVEVWNGMEAESIGVYKDLRSAN